MNDEEEEDLIDDTLEDEIEKRRNEKRNDETAQRAVKQEAVKYTKKAARPVIDKVKGMLLRPIPLSILVVVFMLIGIISFISSMPGIVQEKMYSLIANVAENVNNWWSGENSFLNNPNSEKMKKAKLALVRYLDDMGFDPIGLGFVSSIVRNDDGEILDYSSDLYSDEYLKKLIGATDSGDLLFKYIVSNERTYLPDDDGFKKFFQSTSSVFKGMLSFDTSDANITSKINVDRDSRVMTITAKNVINGILYSQPFAYNLDNWVGIYGKPIEFLLALHMATMSPDLTEALIDNEDLQTIVKIDIEGGEYDVDYSIKMKNEEGDFVDLPIRYGQVTQDDLYEKIKDNIVIDSNGYSFEDTDKISKSDITISSLNHLINSMNRATRDDYEHEMVDGEEFIDPYMTDAIEVFLGTDKYCVKNEVSDIDWIIGYNCSGSYVGKINSSGQIVKETGIFMQSQFDKKNIEYDDSKKEYYYITNANNGAYFVIDSTKNLSVSKDETYPRTTMKVYGLQYYIDNVDKLKNDKNAQKAILWMLAEIDGFTYRNSEMLKLREYKGYGYSEAVSFLETDNVNISEYNDLKLYYALKWKNDIMPALSTKSEGEVKSLLQDLQKEIQTDYEGILKRNEYIQQLIDDILKKKFGDEASGILKISDITTIYKALSNQTDKMKFNEPRIRYVTNHWYKDLDYRNAYTKTNATRKVPLELDNENLEVTAILSNQTHYSQKGQPYVIKGNLVTLDGEDVTEEYGDSGKDIGAGKGYEASKKLFTQGYYYVYDGTQLSSRGIYLNKILEKVEVGNAVKISVVEGRINTLSSVNVSEVMSENKWIANPIGEMEDGVKEVKHELSDYCDIAYAGETVGTGRLEGKTAKWYYIYIKKSIKYQLPTEVSYEESVKSAERINKLLETIEVVNYRKPVSFDNYITREINEDGEVEETVNSSDLSALTAFTVLEGMHTESAAHIYRDLKEFLIELGYYTKAEFEFLNTRVLTWFIPDYIPEDPVHWQQNKREDSLSYGAILYPKKVKDENGEIEQQGFTTDLDIIAPGNCKILEVVGDSIKLEFDGITQPEIGMLNGYTMLISGIKPLDLSDTITVFNSDNTAEIEMTVQEAIDGGNIVKVDTVIGKTIDSKIQIILKDNRGVIINNVEDYMGLKNESIFGDVIMLDVDTEETIQMIWNFEGVSDADGNPNDEYYTVCFPSGDSPTVGHGITPATVATWEELGYYGYIANGTFTQLRIPKEVVDNVSKVEIQKTLSYLDSLLEKANVTWGGNQKAAWVSLYYNGWHSVVESIIIDWGNGDYDSARHKWTEVCINHGTWAEQGHRNRRAQEWVFFKTGELLGQSEAYDLVYNKKQY